MWRWACLIMLYMLPLEAHEGHHHEEGFNWEAILNQLGEWHFVLLHFPIALIGMTLVAELLFLWYRNPLYDHAAKFMIISAALLTIPTFLLGLALASGQHFDGEMSVYLWWHRLLGLSTAALAIVAAILKARRDPVLYLICLCVLFIDVCFTSYFGGQMSFG